MYIYTLIIIIYTSFHLNILHNTYNRIFLVDLRTFFFFTYNKRYMELKCPCWKQKPNAILLCIQLLTGCVLPLENRQYFIRKNILYSRAEERAQCISFVYIGIYIYIWVHGWIRHGFLKNLLQIMSFARSILCISNRYYFLMRHNIRGELCTVRHLK